VGGGAGGAEERAYGAAGLLDLPEGVAAVGDLMDGVECAGAGQGYQLFAVEGGDAAGEVVDGGERAVESASGDDGFGGGLAEAFDVEEADAESGGFCLRG
jgi:hypothetical protein